MTDPQPFSGDNLTASDLQVYTQDRLKSDDPNTDFVLQAALQEVRGYCKWHVCPVTTEVLTLDGPGDWGGLAVGVGGIYYSSGSYMNGFLRRTRPGAQTLYLPTKQLLSINSVIENGVALDVSSLDWGTDGEVSKGDGTRWTSKRRGIQVSFSHGYGITQAADWRRLVLNVADRMSLVRGLVGPFNASLGPYRVSGYYGTSRAGNMSAEASWLDDLFALIDTDRYVRVEI